MKNPLRSFLFRLLFIFIGSSVVCVSLAYVFVESYLSRQIHEQVLSEKDFYLNKLPALHQNPELSKGEMDDYARSHHVLFLQINAPQDEESLNYTSAKMTEALEREIQPYLQHTPDYAHHIVYAHHRYYLFFQERLSDKKHNLHLSILFELDNQAVFLLESNSITSVIVTAITLLLVLIFAFPLLYWQYKQLLNKESELLQTNIETIQALGNAVSKRDIDTHSHNYRVTYYSLCIAEAIGLEKSLIEELIKGAFLHDVGKVAIGDQILLKPGKLSREEYQLMKTHVQHGMDIVEGISWLKEAKNVIRYHHEKYDGSGYPQGIKGTEIPLEARIFAIADVFDALSSSRPYKTPLPPKECMKVILQGSGTHFDPDLVEVFEQLYLQCYQNVAHVENRELERVFNACMEPYFKI